MEQIPIHSLGLYGQHDFSLWENSGHSPQPEVPHRHDYYEFIVFFEGGGTQSIDFINYPNDTSSAYFIRPGQVHMMKRTSQSSGCNFRFLRTYFYDNETGAAAFFREYPFFSLQSHQPQLKLPAEVFTALKKLIEVYSLSEKFASQETLKSLVRAMLQLLKRPFEQAQDTPRHPGTLEKFMALVSSHFNETRSVADYAAMLNITPNYLNELCSGNLGLSAKALIDEQVMLETKRLLFHTDLSVKEIAFQLNFDDASYFVRRFKEKNGLTPAAFRSSVRNDKSY